MIVTKQIRNVGVPEGAAYGNVKTTTDYAIIIQVVGKETYWELSTQAAIAMYPEFPELAIMYPALSFSTSERAKLTFYQSMSLGKLDEDPPDLLNWGKKLPEDGGLMFQHAAKLCKWV